MEKHNAQVLITIIHLMVMKASAFVALGLPQSPSNQVLCCGSTNCPTVAIEDPEAWSIIDAERAKQLCSLDLVASENFASPAVREALGSVLTNKYSEGQPGARYYGGNQHIDEMERLCQSRALSLYGLKSDEWRVNVQPYSGSIANLVVYTALLKPHDRIMGLYLPSGGHISHGYYSAKKKISSTSIFFESLPYEVDPETGLIDYDGLRKQALLFRPKLIVVGASSYPRDFNYECMREIADSVGALLLTDMAHIGGLVAANEVTDPFKHSHVVTTTTHKTLRGPRGAIIFSRQQFSDMIDFAVFPRLQGGPHNNQIAALAIALKEASTDKFRTYAKQVKANARALASALQEHGYTIVTGGTDNHIVLWDLRPTGITGHKMEVVLDHVAIVVNRNTLHGDKSAIAPGGVRLGTPAMTTRGFVEKHFKRVADMLHRCVKIAKRVESRCASNKLTDLKAALEGDSHVEALRSEVEEWTSQFFYP